MIERALDAGVTCRWVTGDSIYGGDRKLRLFLEQRQQPFVLAVAANEPLMWEGPYYKQPRQIAASIPAQQWQRVCVGDGAKGPRLHEWAWAELWRLQLTEQEQAQGHWLLMRRSVDDPNEMAYYVVFAPRNETTLQQVATVAGMRWSIESCFAAAKSQCGLDQYEVRTWDAWHRHVTLAMWALAFLTVMSLQEAQLTQPAQSTQKGGLLVNTFPCQ
jgi:SRSO17 transposase